MYTEDVFNLQNFPLLKNFIITSTQKGIFLFQLRDNKESNAVIYLSVLEFLSIGAKNCMLQN